MRLYKFYPAHWGREALQQKRLKITTRSDLNDPFEFTAAALTDATSRKWFLRWRAELLTNTGLISFCKQWSNPVIWSHYADSHKGMCLGFDVSELHISKVEYINHRIDLAEHASRRQFPPEDQLGARLLKTKFAHWAYEDEHRMFFALDEKLILREKGMYFHPFCEDFVLREVILGSMYESPKEPPTGPPSLKGVKVKAARIAFGKFAIVSQRSPSLQKAIYAAG